MERAEQRDQLWDEVVDNLSLHSIPDRIQIAEDLEALLQYTERLERTIGVLCAGRLPKELEKRLIATLGERSGMLPEGGG